MQVLTGLLEQYGYAVLFIVLMLELLALLGPGEFACCSRVSRKVKLGAKHVSGRIGELCGSEHVVLDRV